MSADAWLEQAAERAARPSRLEQVRRENAAGVAAVEQTLDALRRAQRDAPTPLMKGEVGQMIEALAERYRPHTCEWCRSPFVASRRGQSFCTEYCRTMAKAKKRRAEQQAAEGKTAPQAAGEGAD